MGATRNKQNRSHMRDWTANPAIRHSRSVFNLSKTIKTTFDAGKLIPLWVQEALPGDTFRARLNALVRLATPIHPVMDNIFLDVHFWLCPIRQLWENAEKFFGEQRSPGDSTDFLIPQIDLNGMTDESKELADYMNLPVQQITGSRTVNVLPFRMYYRVWNEHYRDANLQNERPHATGDGPDQGYVVLRRGKRHDYFTSALPFQQRGPAVPLALGGTAPIFTSIDTLRVNNATPHDGTARTLTGVEPGFNNQFGTAASGSAGLFADLGAATAATIAQFRESVAIQQVLERDARGGVRYPEQLVSRFGVVDPQLMVLQRPEYIGGGSQMVAISPVPQTTPKPESGTNQTVQGNLAAVGTAMINGNIGFTKSTTEHSYIMMIISARADLNYQQGIERFWLRKERFDFYTPELAQISEQPIYNAEIYADGTAADLEVWGYNGAYDDYRTSVSNISGRFRSKPVSGATLHAWHLAQEFASRPALNDAFIQDNPPIDRIIAVQDEPQFILDAYLDVRAARILPLLGIPGLTRI